MNSYYLQSLKKTKIVFFEKKPQEDNMTVRHFFNNMYIKLIERN